MLRPAGPAVHSQVSLRLHVPDLNRGVDSRCPLAGPRDQHLLERPSLPDPHRYCKVHRLLEQRQKMWDRGAEGDLGLLEGRKV